MDNINWRTNQIGKAKNEKPGMRAEGRADGSGVNTPQAMGCGWRGNEEGQARPTSPSKGRNFFIYDFRGISHIL